MDLASERADEYRQIGRRLAAAREVAGLTQREIARKLGVAEATYSQYESGRRGISGPDLARLADILCVSVDFLVGRTEEAMDEVMAAWVQAIDRDLHVPAAARQWVRDLALADRAREREMKRRAKPKG